VAPVGYAVLAGSAQGPNGAYLIDASEQVADLEPLTGKVLWLASTGSSFSFTPPALDQGQLIVGDEVGFVFDFSSSAVVPHYPIDGVVVNRTGVPVAGATVAGPGVSTTTSANGSFSVALPNGTFTLVVSALGYPPTNYTIVVNGPHAPVTIALAPLRLYRVEGQVVDALSGAPIPAVNVRVFGAYGYFAENTSDAGGFFQLAVPNGSDYFTVDPPTGYQGIQFRAFVTAGVAVSGPIILALPSTVFLPPSGDPYDSVVIVGVLAAGVAVLVAGLGWRARRKAELGLSQSLLTPFERFLAMRGLLIVPQIVAILVILYVFGTFLPAAALSQDPCSIVGGGCTGCSWSNFACVLTIFAQGFWTFLVNLFTGQWGIAAYGNLRAPAAQFISWWGPYTVELAVVALLMAALIAYPLGLWAGWRPERTVDTSTRVLSIAALLVPSFLVVLLVLGVAYEPFLRTIGDEPYGILPSQTWFVMHGGIPSWVGPGGNTLPTGFPLVDVALHGEWTIETIVLAKTLLQAFLIAIVFIAIFLRFARHTVAEAVAEPHLSASRARGVPEPRLLWYHTGRRVLPIFILILGLTIPVYIGTQALVEAMFNDPGLGTLLLAEMTNVEVTRFGFASLNGLHPGNVYQVAIFFTALVVLLASLCADIIARLLDPRLAANEGV
jgi:ABC-type dipeptide/oligopeptide/nickel transport system permease component